ncbi:MAG: hypothetical protein JWQ32_394 [Marmoricola sp.]|nr:hypothetical protein [Marmoricola sp.]
MTTPSTTPDFGSTELSIVTPTRVRTEKER